MKTCPGCGAEVSFSAANYCGECGTDLRQAFEGKRRGRYVCTRCGHRVEGEAHFCPQCGGSDFLDIKPQGLMKCGRDGCGRVSKRDSRCHAEGCDGIFRIGAPIIRVMSRRIEIWTVDSLLGQGGMGAVYKTHNRKGEVRVLKEMRMRGANNDGSDEDLRVLLRNESIVAAKLKGLLGFCQLFGYFEYDGSYFLVLELVPGREFQVVIEEAFKRSHRPFTDRGIYDIVLFFAKLIQRAHAKGIILRDFKPSNVMVDDTWTWKIIDFGLSYPGSEYPDLPWRVGTPGYAPPEQWRNGVQPRPAWDVCALCVTAHYMLTGRNPVEQNKDYPYFYWPGTDPHLEEVLKEGMSLQIGTMDELMRRLENIKWSILGR